MVIRYSFRTAVVTMFLLAGASVLGQENQVKQIKVTLRNPTAIARPNEPIVITLADIAKAAPDFKATSFIVTTSDAATPADDARAKASRPLACQADDLDGDGKADEIAFEVDLAPLSTKVVTISYGAEELIKPLRVSFPKRAHASFQTKYEGMGWESDRVAWRMYFDARNAFDMYGKRQHCLALDYFAQPGVDYHAESPIGRDTFKIGDALGIGSAGAYVDGKAVKISEVTDRKWKVIADGPVRAIFDLIYTGWSVAGKKVDINSRVTVWAGQHWFDHAITARNANGVTLITGLPRKPGVAFSSGVALENGQARYTETWGHQALMPGATATEAHPDQNLGLGIIVLPGAGGSADELPDAADHIVRVPVTTMNGTITTQWRVVSAWDQEQPDGDSVLGLDPAMTLPVALRSEEGWKRYVAGVASRYAQPVTVSVLP
ncbi:MAG TPA: DUF4861 family protein [Armatimonadota bacterium]|jgi:hypothetical protein